MELTTTGQSLRADHGLVQRDLAEALGRSETWVSLQLCGRRPISDKLEGALSGYLLGRGMRPDQIRRIWVRYGRADG
jgi:transcriptional regulator with XRE-family HTH domain